MSYALSLLKREPRSSYRLGNNIYCDTAIGYDVLTIHGISFLTDNGLPVIGYGRLVYPCFSKYIVEARSLYSYILSYNSEKLGTDAADAIDVFIQQIIIDLSDLVGDAVSFKFYQNKQDLLAWNIFSYTEKKVIFTEFPSIDTIDGIDDIDFNELNNNQPVIYRSTDQFMGDEFTSNLVRFNCSITHLPVHMTLSVYYYGKRCLDKLSFISYLISLGQQEYLQEEIIEVIYAKLYEILNPKELIVVMKSVSLENIDVDLIRASIINNKLHVNQIVYY